VSGAFIEIGYLIGSEVCPAGSLGAMQLPDVLEPGHMMQRLERRQCAALFQAVVHDRDPWPESGKGGGIRGIRAAMMGNHVHIDRPDQTPRTGQIEQRLTGQITDVKKSKLAKANQDAGRAWILIRIACRQRRRAAGGVALARGSGSARVGTGDAVFQ